MNRREFLRSIARAATLVAGAGGVAALAQPAANPYLTALTFDRFVKRMVRCRTGASLYAPIIFVHPGDLRTFVTAGIPEHLIACYERPAK